MSIFFDISKINKNIFIILKHQKVEEIFLKLRLIIKDLNLIDESYNSNPLSLKSAILNFDKIKTQQRQKNIYY